MRAVHSSIVVQSLSRVQLFATPWTAAHQASLSFTISQSLLKLIFFELVMPFSHLSLCYSLLPLPSIFPSISLFQPVGSLHQVAKVLELQLQHQSFQWIFWVDVHYNWLVWPPCSPRDSQESSPTTQLKSTVQKHSCFLYGPKLISIHDYWKKQSSD